MYTQRAIKLARRRRLLLSAAGEAAATPVELDAYTLQNAGGTAIVDCADPRNFLWNADGTKLITYNDAASYSLYSATCSTPYDPSTVGSFTDGTGSGSERIRSFQWNGDGTVGWGLEPAFSTMHRFVPDDPYGVVGTWDAGFATTVHPQDTFCFNSDGTKVFFYSQADDLCYSFDLADPYVIVETDIDVGDETESINLDTVLGTGTVIEDIMLDPSGTRLIVWDSAGATDAYRQINLASVDTLTGATDAELSITAPNALGTSITFWNDGDDFMFESNVKVYHYSRT